MSRANVRAFLRRLCEQQLGGVERSELAHTPRLRARIEQHPCVESGSERYWLADGGGELGCGARPVMITDGNCIEAAEMAREGRIDLVDYFTGETVVEPRAANLSFAAFAHPPLRRPGGAASRAFAEAVEDGAGQGAGREAGHFNRASLDEMRAHVREAAACTRSGLRTLRTVLAPELAILPLRCARFIKKDGCHDVWESE